MTTDFSALNEDSEGRVQPTTSQDTLEAIAAEQARQSRKQARYGISAEKSYTIQQLDFASSKTMDWFDGTEVKAQKLTVVYMSVWLDGSPALIPCDPIFNASQIHEGWVSKFARFEPRLASLVATAIIRPMTNPDLFMPGARCRMGGGGVARYDVLPFRPTDVHKQPSYQEGGYVLVTFVRLGKVVKVLLADHTPPPKMKALPPKRKEREATPGQ